MRSSMSARITSSGTQRTCVHERLSLHTNLSACFHSGSKHITRRDLWKACVLGDALGLRTLPSPRRSE